ncbi:MAG: hypothetical protein AAF632_28050 [Bacteroidota bacterium]
MPYQKNIKLRQYSPIIHFQSDQTGATLRATEVKPKLDRFLLSKFKKASSLKTDQDLVQHTTYQKWVRRVANERLSLKYKISIKANDQNSNRGSISIISQEQRWIYSSNPISLTFTSFYEELLDQIDTYANEFFAIHNFGKRQSKGWGSFMPNNIKSAEDFEKLLSSSGKVFFKRNRAFGDELDGFDSVVNYEWRLLKSGLNPRENRGQYRKSLLFKYMCQRGVRWEKKAIKQMINRIAENTHIPALKSDNPSVDCVRGEDGCTDAITGEAIFNSDDNNHYGFVRAILGLPEHYEFLNERNGRYTIKVDSGDVKRFKSPVTFKIFDGHIYVMPEAIPSELFDATFSFTLKGVNTNVPPLRLTVPRNFDLEEFLTTYLRCIGYDRVN